MPWDRNDMAARAAQELEDGFYVNLGIGIPTLVSNYVPEDYDITLQSENGMLGMGPFPTEEEIDEIFADDITDDGGITRLCTIGRHGTACIVELGAT